MDIMINGLIIESIEVKESCTVEKYINIKEKDNE